MKKAILLAIASTLLVVSCTKSADSFYANASALVEANDSAGAERVFRKGILAHPNDRQLSQGLLTLYLNTKQWTKLSDYLAIDSDAGYYNIRYQAYWALGQHSFDSKQFLDAYNFYFQAGMTMDSANSNSQAYDPNLVHDCNKYQESALAYSNAAAAAFNIRDASRVQQALQGLNLAIGDMNVEIQGKYCQNGDAKEMLDEASRAQRFVSQLQAQQQ